MIWGLVVVCGVLLPREQGEEAGLIYRVKDVVPPFTSICLSLCVSFMHTSLKPAKKK